MPSARERVRAELTAEITDAARRQLAEVGRAALSLRAVAREVGMVSSAVYRYFPSRDDLLTRLIIDGYDDLGAAAEAADDPSRRPPSAGWRSAGGPGLGLAHPHEYALLYGSPCPATGADGHRAGRLAGRRRARPHPRRGRAQAALCPTAGGERDPGLVSDDAVAVLGGEHPALDETVRVRALLAWSALYGTISFELFGHFVGSVEDGDRFFDRRERAGCAVRALSSVTGGRSSILQGVRVPGRRSCRRPLAPSGPFGLPSADAPCRPARSGLEAYSSTRGVDPPASCRARPVQRGYSAPAPGGAGKRASLWRFGSVRQADPTHRGLRQNRPGRTVLLALGSTTVAQLKAHLPLPPAGRRRTGTHPRGWSPPRR
jgi:AcrR family transcriptional regulator